MFHHYITKYTENGIRYAEAWIQIDFYEGRKMEYDKTQTIEETGHGDEIFIDEWGNRIFKSDMDHVQGGIDKVNDERDEGMDLPFSDKGDENFPIATAFNDFYIAWDIEPSGLGATFGYPASDDWYDSRRIPFKIITLDEKDMDPVMWKRYLLRGAENGV